MSNRKTHPLKYALSIYLLMAILLSPVLITPWDSANTKAEQIMEKNEELGGSSFEMAWDYWLAQSFNASGNYFTTKVSIFVMDQWPVDDFITVEIWSNKINDPGDPFDDEPLGSMTPPEVNNGGDNKMEWLEFYFSLSLTAGERYWIVARADGNMGEGYVWLDSGFDSYSDGFMVVDGNSEWKEKTDNDLLFRVYGEMDNDVGVDQIIAPRSQDLFLNTKITGIIKNYGIFGQGPFNVNCIIYDPFGGELINDIQSIGFLAAGAEMPLEWFFVPFMEGTYTIIVRTLLAGDEYPQNDEMIFDINVKAEAVLKLHEDIVIDGAPFDWYGDSGIPEDSWRTSRREFIWRDAFGDDTGDGDYVYPLHSRYEPGCLDLLEFRVCVDSDTINFLLEFGSIDDSSGDGTDGPLGFSEQIVEILIDTDRDGTGRQDTIRNARLKVDQSMAWEYSLWVNGFGEGYIEDEFGFILKDEMATRGNFNTNTVEISIPAIGPGIPDFEKWGYTVLIGAEYVQALSFDIEDSRSGFANVDKIPSVYTGGGGLDINFADPNVYDLAFADPQKSQLNNYGNWDLELISFTNAPPSSGADVDMMERWAQSFIAPKTCLLSEVEIFAQDVGFDSTSLTIVISSNDDMDTADPTDDVPSDEFLSSVELVDFPLGAYDWGFVLFSNPPVLAEGQTYWIMANAFDPKPDGYLWGRQGGNQFPEGAAARHTGMFWVQYSDDDLLFIARYKDLTNVDAHHTVYFAPIVINKASINGSENDEWIELYYNGTDFAPDLDMDGWILTDQDGNIFSFISFSISNKRNVTVHTGFGADTANDLYWGLVGDVWDDAGDDILLGPDFLQAADYMNYTNGIMLGDPPPLGINWEPEFGENLPKNPKTGQMLYLKEYGTENDFFSDWKISFSGRYEDKSLYFFDDNTFTELDPYDFMNTVFPVGNMVSDFDGDTNPGLTLKKSGPKSDPERFQEFNLTPKLAKEFKVVSDVIVDLWLDDDGQQKFQTVDVTLFDCNETKKIEIGKQQMTFESDAIIGWELVTVTIPSVDHVLPKDHYLVLHVMANSTSANDLWLAYNTSNEPSGIRQISTRTYVNVEWAKTFNLAEVEMTDFDFGEDVLIKANVSDPLGSYDIAGANITVIKPSGPGAPGEVPMILEMTDPDNPSAWKIFNYTFSDTDEVGVYTVRIKGIESNGVIHILTIYFNVLPNNPPVLTSPALIPSSGNMTSWFNFTVEYSDLDNDPPNVITVNITNYGIISLDEVDPGDTDYTDGKFYYANLTGFDYETSYSHHFAASDSIGFWVETAELGGPFIINIPPSLSNPTINFDTGNASTSFTYTVTYTDLENQAPDSITVNITGPLHSGNWQMEEVDSGDTDYTDGKEYNYTYSGYINGSYSFHFAASDSEGAWDETFEDPRPIVVNSVPILVDPKVLPVSGYIDTLFNFTVTYYDLDNHPPSNISVNITGLSHSGPWVMLEVDGSDIDYTDGKNYYYTWFGFVIDSYSFHCAANDTEGAWRETPEIFEPIVLNSRPTLSDHNLLPSVGDPGVTDFNYTVTYTDLDNQAPTEINVTIFGPSGGNYSMIAVDPLDLDYSDGKEYYYNTTLAAAGTYSYRFDAWDSGGLWAIAILDSGPSVGQEEPVLSQPDVSPIIGIRTTLYNFTVNYSDQQNDPAGIINLSLSGPVSGNFTMLEVDPGDMTTSDGKFFYYETSSLTKGLYSFIIYGEDNKGNPTVSTEKFDPKVRNSLPQLSGGYINESEFGESWFNFTVTYLDIDNDFQTEMTLNITGLGIYTMNELDPGDTNYADGKDFYYNITISKGSYSYHFAALDSGLGINWNETTPQGFTLKNNIPSFQTQDVTPPTGFGGDEFNFTVSIVDYDNEVISLIIYIQGEPGSPFTMVELDPLDVVTSDGKVFFYTITLPKGTYNYNFSVYDGFDANQTTPLILNVKNNPPVITTLDVGSIFEDSFYDVDYDYLDLDGDSITWSLDTDALWLNFDAILGRIYGTPTNQYVGNYYVNISVDDGDGGIDSHNFSLDVINTDPVITTPPTEFASEDFMHLDDFDCVDDGQGTIIYSFISNASWLSIVPNSGLLSGTPDNTEVGWYWVNVSVDDGNGGVYSINYSLTVNNTPPSILTVPLQIALEDSLHLDDFNCDDDSQGNIVYTLNSNATWLNLNPLIGILSGTPDNSQVGWFWVNVSVTDGNGGFDFINYSITVFNINDPPVITTIDMVMAMQDIPYSVDYEAIDIDPTQDILVWSMVTNASWLSMNTTSGLVNGTPTNFDIGSYWVDITVSDGKGGFDNTNFTLTVTDTNDPPQITNPLNLEFAPEDSYYEVDYNYTDIDDPVVTWILKTNGSWLSIDPITGILNGTPDNSDVGFYWVNVTVDDSRGGIDFTNFTITVNNTLPSLTNAPDEFAQEDLFHWDDFECDDDLQGNVSYTYGTNATWIAFDPITGVLSGTANNTQIGWYWVNITFYDGNGGVDSVNYTLTVNNTPPSILTVPIQNGVEDTLLLDDFNCDDDTQGNIVYNLISNASWLIINPVTGVLSGTPDNSHVGVFWVNVSVTDGNGGIDSINYSITVSNVNDPPQITTTDVTSATEDILYSVDYEALDIDPTLDTLTWTLQTNATWLSFNTTTGVLVGTPTNWEIGSYWVNVSVSDGNGGFDYTNFSLNVIEVNDPPQITSSDLEFALEDSYYETDYNFTDIDDFTVTWFLNTNSTWLSIDSATGMVYGTPDNSEVGWYWINVTVDDGRGGIDFTNFTLTVNNTPPLITNIPVEFTDEDTMFCDDFDCDDDLQGNITYLLSTNASWITIDPVTGIINGTSNNTHVGWYWINITVDDGNGGYDFRNYTISVNNSLPTITTSPITFVYEDSEYQQDFDCEDDGQGVIIYSMVTNASWLSIDPITGLINGTPGNDDVGSYWVNITVSDGKGGLHSINYTLFALNTNDPPQIIAGQPESIDEDSAYNFNYGFTDIDLDSVTWSINSNASWLSINPISGQLSGTPRNNNVGEFYVNVSANDGNGGSDYVYFTIVVNNTNDLPQIPQLILPTDDSSLNTTSPVFTWSASQDPDIGDTVVYYILQYSTSSDFTENLTTVPYIINTSFTPINPLSDKTVYYWRVEAFDTYDIGSGFQSSHYVFTIDSGYFPPLYIGGLKSVALSLGGEWTIDLDDYFESGSITDELIYTSNYEEIEIDPVTHIATWTPKDKNSELTDVIFTASDGTNEISSFPFDLTVKSEITMWERIFWPYSLIPLLFLMLLAGAVMVKKWKNRPFIEEGFFISENGRLISHASVYTGEEVDEDILSGMLTGVKDLITDAFVKEEEAKEEKGLHKLEFGDSNIMLEKGNHFFLALVFKGIENRAMFKKIKGAISEIESRYGDVLADWDGDMDAFEGADEIIQGLLSTELLTEGEKEKIKEKDKDEKIIEKWSSAMMDSVDEDGQQNLYEEETPQEENEENPPKEIYEDPQVEGEEKEPPKTLPPPPPPEQSHRKLNRIK